MTEQKLSLKLGVGASAAMLALGLVLAGCNTQTATTPSTSTNSSKAATNSAAKNDAMMKDDKKMMGVMMKDGKMMEVMSNGEMMMMDKSDMMMGDTKVMKSGEMMMKDGSKMMMKDGMMMMADGTMMMKTDGKMMMDDKMMATTDTKAAGLRTLLSALYTEHVDYASMAVRAGFDGSKTFEAAAAALGKNTDDIANAVGSVYGKDAGDKFKIIWSSHIGFFVDYTLAAKKGDKAGMDKAVENLKGYADAISDFLSGANPNLPRQAVYDLVWEHVTLLKDAVDTYGAGKYAESYDAQRKAATQIRGIADTVSGAIVKQYPDKF